MARPKKLPKVLTTEEQCALVAQPNPRYTSGLRNRCLIRVALEAGLRAGELVALKPDHLDMLTCRLVVREGKGAKDRVLWISDNLRDLVGRWLERRPVSAWLFPTRDGGQLDTRYLRTMVKHYAVKAGVSESERVTPHVLRHTFATDLLRETKNIILVQKALGHSDVSTTMIYTHVQDDEPKAALRRRET
ncbi:MAG: integrase [Actinobacteria bacterium]|nr:MAG: integrase [Actinomycetota bacterium]